ncbi:DNA-binding protein [Bacillus paranthracis]
MEGVFASLFMMGVFLFVTKIVVWILNKFTGASITLVADAPYVMNFLPLILMVIGGIGSDKLKKIYIDRGNNSPH